MRRLERSYTERPRIGDSASRRDEYVVLGQDPYMDFPASNLSKFEREAAEPIPRVREIPRVARAAGRAPAGDDRGSARLELDARRRLSALSRHSQSSLPAAVLSQPGRTPVRSASMTVRRADRFIAYVGSMIGIGSPPYRDRDAVPDAAKLAFSGLMAPQAKSASRLRSLIGGFFGVDGRDRRVRRLTSRIRGKRAHAPWTQQQRARHRYPGRRERLQCAGQVQGPHFR